MSANTQDRESIERIIHKGTLYALICRNRPIPEGVHFVTDPDDLQQIGLMKHPVGHVVRPHTHSSPRQGPMHRIELLFVRSGKIRANLYADSGAHLSSHLLASGDFVVLLEGGHGFDILEEAELFEVAGGPYQGLSSKVWLDTEITKRREREVSASA